MDTAHAQTRRFATSSHAHFQEHDLRSRAFATVILYEIFPARSRLNNTAWIRYAPFVKVSTVFRIVLICVTIVSATKHILSDLLKKPFSVRQSGEQNIRFAVVNNSSLYTTQ